MLLILNEPDRIFNASTCGDNCAKWILEIGRIKDVTINLRHMMSFGKDTKFEIKVQKWRRNGPFNEGTCSYSK